MNQLDNYIAQGYEIPAPFTREQIENSEARLWKGEFIFVPLCVVPGVAAGWGVPYINGKPLKRIQ